MTSDADQDRPDHAMAVAEPGPGSRALVAVDGQLEFYAPTRDLRHRVRRFMPYFGAGMATIVGGSVLAATLGPTGAVAGMVFGMLGALGAWTVGGVVAATDGEEVGRLLKARAQWRQHPEQSERILAGIARTSRSDQLRLEAAGHLALRDLLRGEADRAVRWLSFETSDDARPQRERGLERGLIGELMRTLLAWIRPGSFRGVASSAGFELEQGQQSGLARPADVIEFEALVGLLRLFEVSASGSESEVLAQLDLVRTGPLPRIFPRLVWLASAFAARRVEAEAAALRRASPGELEWLGRVLPDLDDRLSAADAYRFEAADPEAEGRAQATLAVMKAPAEVADKALARLAPQEMRADQARAVVRWAGGLGLAAGLAWMAMLTWPVAGMVVYLLTFYGLPPIALTGALNGFLRARARAKIHPVRTLDPRTPTQWVAEFAASPLARQWNADITPHLELYVAAVMAEHDLADGEPGQGWSRLSWWFHRLTPSAQPRQPLAPVAASLLRVAALAGETVSARRLLQALGSERRAARVMGKRTVYGDAARAVDLARALLEARVGQYDAAADALVSASESPRVWMHERDRVLYARVAAVVAGRIDAARRAPVAQAVKDLGLESRGEADAEHLPWVRRLWPELEP